MELEVALQKEAWVGSTSTQVCSSLLMSTYDQIGRKNVIAARLQFQKSQFLK